MLVALKWFLDVVWVSIFQMFNDVEPFFACAVGSKW